MRNETENRSFYAWLRLVFAGGLLAICSGLAATGASAAGFGSPGEPVVKDVVCLSKCIGNRTGIVGSLVRITGTDLSQTTSVSFASKGGGRVSDRQPDVKSNGSVLAKVVARATNGKIRVTDTFGQQADSKILFKVGTRDQLEETLTGWTFPVRAGGKHTYGDGLGAGRGHQGQDVLASCGTKLVAARGGKVKWKAYQGGGAGHYLVIDGAETSYDFVYMHLRSASPVPKGATVRTGQEIGRVGSTGRSTACHLHFEMWTAPGWFDGGRPYSGVTRMLKLWDSFS